MGLLWHFPEKYWQFGRGNVLSRNFPRFGEAAPAGQFVALFIGGRNSMQTVFTVQNGNLVPQEEPGKQCWINLVNPDTAELEALEQRYEMPMEFLQAALDPDERARYEVEDDTILILIRIPVVNHSDTSEIPYITRPLAIVIKADVLLTICLVESPMMEDFLNEKVKNFNPENQLRFVLQLFYRNALRFLRYLRDINTRTSAIELELQKSQKNADLIKLLNYEKSLVFFTTSLRSNQIMMDRFKRTRFFRQAVEDERELLEDIIIDNTQAIEMANIYTNILSGLMDAFASVISNNLNAVMKTLTKITIVLMLPTFVASLYGMNVKLPFQEAQSAFLLITLFCVILIIGGFIVFSNKRLF